MIVNTIRVKKVRLDTVPFACAFKYDDRFYIKTSKMESPSATTLLEFCVDLQSGDVSEFDSQLLVEPKYLEIFEMEED